MENRDLVRRIEDTTRKLEERVGGYKTSAFSRFPALFIGLSTFGLVATLYGFEKLIDSIPVLANNPLLILFTGLLALTITGTLYKKLN